MENCRFNNSWPIPDVSLADWEPNKVMSPQEHYDLLAKVFIAWCGVKPENFRVHAVMARQAVKQPRASAQALPRITLHTPPGGLWS